MYSASASAYRGRSWQSEEVHEPPPRRRAVADEKEVFGREKHRVQHIRERCAVFRGDAVDRHLPPPAAREGDLRLERALAREDVPHELRPLTLEAEQLPVGARAGALAAGEVDDRLQQVLSFPARSRRK